MSLLRATGAYVSLLISILFFVFYVRMHAETFGLRSLRLHNVYHAYSGYFIRRNVNYMSISLRERRSRFMTRRNVPDLIRKYQRNFIQS